jgi:hypothetical protein
MNYEEGTTDNTDFTDVNYVLSRGLSSVPSVKSVVLKSVVCGDELNSDGTKKPREPAVRISGLGLLTLGRRLNTSTGPAIRRAKAPKPKLDRGGFHNAYCAIGRRRLQARNGC